MAVDAQGVLAVKYSTSNGILIFHEEDLWLELLGEGMAGENSKLAGR